MSVTTRSQIRQKIIQNQTLINKLNLSNPKSPPILSDDDPADGKPPILSDDDPADGKPPCYLTWGRFLLEKEYKKSSGMPAKLVAEMVREREDKHRSSSPHSIGHYTNVLEN